MKRWFAGMPIRWKLAGAFIAVLIWMGSVCSLQLIVFSGYMGDYNRVLDGIAHANAASGMLKTELDAEVREIVSGRLPFGHGKQYEIIAQIGRQLDEMRSGESEPAMLAALDTAGRTLQSLHDKIDYLGEQYKVSKSVDEQTDTMEYILIMTEIVEEELQGIIRQKLLAGEKEQMRISDGFQRGAFVSVVLFAAVFLLSGLTAWLMSEAVAKPLRKLGVHTAELADGNLAAGRVEAAGNDEIGMLCRAFNGMSDSLTAMVLGIHQSGRHAFQFADRIKRGVERHREVSGAEAEAALHISGSLKAQNELAQAVFREFERLTQAFREVMSQARRVQLHSEQSLRLSTEGAMQMRNFAEQFSEMRLAVNEAAGDAGELLSLFAEMSRLLEQIRRIAGESNVLALNAGIEAARGCGGDRVGYVPYGSGASSANRSFSVIARRMRELAGHTAQLAANADDNIRSVGGKIDEINRLMIDSMDRLEGSRRLSDAAQRSFADIADANGTVRHNAELTMADMDGAIVRLRHVSGNVSELVRQSALIESEMTRMMQLGVRQEELLSELSGASAELSLHNRSLNGAVARFVLPEPKRT